MKVRKVVAAAVVAAALTGGVPSAFGGPVTNCTEPGPRSHGGTQVPLVFTTVSTNGNDAYYQSSTMYAYVSPDGAYGRRHGSTAGEPANSIAFNVNTSSICVASPAAGVGYQLP